MDSRKFLSQVEIENLESLLKARLESEPRDATMILLALYTGARASELLALRWQDINTDNGEVFIQSLKGGRPRPVVVPRFLREALARWRALSPVRPFAISYNRLGEIWRLYRPVQKPFHSLRHTFAMRVLRKTGNVHFVQRTLGHRSINSTMVYLDYEYTSSEFRKMMRVR